MTPPSNSSTSYSTKPISSFFAPQRKPVEKENKPKVAIKSALKSSNLRTTESKASEFTPGPFSLKRSGSNSSSTEKITKSLASFRFNSQEKPPLVDLNTTHKRLRQRFGSFDNDDEEEEEEEEEEGDEEDDDEEDEEDNSFRRKLRTRKPMKKLQIQISSDEESEEEEPEEEGEDEETDKPLEQQRTTSSRKRQIMSESEEEDIIMVEDDSDLDDSYVDRDEKLNRSLESSSEEATFKRICKLYPHKTHEEVRAALFRAGTAVNACRILMGDVSNPNKRFRMLDEEELSRRARERLTEAQKEDLVLKYFNTCTPKDLQEMTGCKATAADKIVKQMRPFSDMEDLEGKLRHSKETSIKYITTCREMMDGYTAVDGIIEKIENLGAELNEIFNIWKGVDANSRSGSPAAEGEDDQQPGMEMAKINLDVEKTEHKDAVNGYLTKQPECVNPEFTLKDYQILGVNWMLLLFRKGISGILADEMGLGKTAQVISFLGRLYEIGEHGPHLIIVPSSTIENWAREFKRFCPSIEVRLYHGSQKERQEQRLDLEFERKQSAFQVIITTYQLASGHVDDRKFLKRLRCHSMILDEGHMVKNCFSARYKALMSIKTPFRLLLTGTPLQNNLQELVSLLTFIMPDTFADHEEEVRSIFKIRTTYDKKNDKESSNKATETSLQVLSRERINRAKKMMTPFVLRRKKENVLKDLPKKNQVIEHCDMTENQAQLYADIMDRTKKSYEESLEGNAEKVKKSDMDEQFDSMSNIVIHLRKAADHPLLFRKVYNDDLLRVMAKEIHTDVKYWDSDLEYIYEDMTVMSDFELHNLCKSEPKIKHHMLQNEEWMDSGKVNKLKELLPKCKQKGNKVLIFSQFTKMLDILELVMKTMNISFLRLDGETKVMERQAMIDDFNENKDVDVFLLSTKAGGFGINLTSANIVILYDLDFNPQNDKQAEDRAHRVGQTKDVTIYKLIAKDSIEEYILKLANMKLRLDKNISAKEGEEDQQQEETQSLYSMIKEAFKFSRNSKK